jgi:pimeloyl-ACP methyl ester carboxylesterase
MELQMRQTIQMCSAPDGVRIAWARVGSGPPLVKAANWLNHLEYDWESPVWRHVFRALARDFELIRYDERGNGLSDWDAEDISFDAFVQDLETVVEAAGVERFALLGVSQGCAVSVAYAVRHPERVSRMVLYGGFAAGWTHGSPRAVARQEALVTLSEQGWGRDNPAYRQLFTSLFLPDGTTEQQDWLTNLQRATTSPANAVRLQRAIGAIDVRDLLAKVEIPTLVLHAKDDAVVSFGNGRALAAAIPGARFVQLPGRNHMLLEHDPGWRRFLEEVLDFLADGARSDPSGADGVDLDRWLVTGGAMGGALGREIGDELGREEHPILPQGFAGGDALAGRYRIVERIGGGGMGVVLRARDTVLERDVAVKVVTGSVRAGSWRERVLREARAAAALNHRNIVAIHDIGEHDGTPYLVMEVVPGPSLADEPPATVEDSLAVACQICEALDHAHRRGIVHRDLKAANILLDRADDPPTVKLVDLGISLATGSERLTGTGQLLGTPTCLAPEQALGGVVDGRTDLYALGVLLYEWAVGAPPFSGDDAMSVVSQHVHVAPVPPTDHRPDLPEALSSLILRLLSKDPEQRPASAADVRTELERML